VLTHINKIIMTPTQAQAIFHKARMDEYHAQRENLKPVDEPAITLAGFQAVINAVTHEIDNDWSMRYLAMQQIAARFMDDTTG